MSANNQTEKKVFMKLQKRVRQQTVVFLTVSVPGVVLFPVHHTEAVLAEAAQDGGVGGRGEIGCWMN